MNIFEITGKTETIHSRFLAECLRDSAKGIGDRRSLFDRFWKLTAPCDWEIPASPEIADEEFVDDSRMRIDICIRSNDQHNRILGVEVKTSEGSTTEGQLKAYREGLKNSCPNSDVAMVYLTPFNLEGATKLSDEVKAKSLPTVRELAEFLQEIESSRAKHISWLDLADIPWDGNELWKQHQAYVKGDISAKTILEENSGDRTLADFFGEEAVRKFRQALKNLRINVGELGDDINIDLNDFRDDPSFGERLAKALILLIENGDRIRRDRKRGDAFDGRDRFLNSEYRDVHATVFLLADSYAYVWLKGEGDYGVRVLHESTGGEISLLTSCGTDGFHIRGRR